MRLRFAPLVSVALFAACGSSPAGPQSPHWEAAGSYGVGLHTYMLVDSSRPTPANGSYAGSPSRALTVEVWYPSSMKPTPDEEEFREAPVAKGPFPLVVHSHGFMDSRRGEAYLGQHLASHGYVVAAPDFPLSNGGAPGGPTVLDTPNQPGDVSFIIDSLVKESQTAGSPIAGAVDATKVGASGLSLGGLTTLLVAFHPRLHDARVLAALPMAPPSCMLTAPFFSRAVPVLFLHGDMDLIVPVDANSERVFPLAQEPKSLVLLHPGSHTGFAGFASLFDKTKNYDRLGCSALASVDVSSFGALGTADEGIAQDPSVCPKPCTGTPVDPSLDADRQHQLTSAIALAFFESRLRGDAAAERFLETTLATENPEVMLQR